MFEPRCSSARASAPRTRFRTKPRELLGEGGLLRGRRQRHRRASRRARRPRGSRPAAAPGPPGSGPDGMPLAGRGRRRSRRSSRSRPRPARPRRAGVREGASHAGTTCGAGSRVPSRVGEGLALAEHGQPVLDHEPALGRPAPGRRRSRRPAGTTTSLSRIALRTTAPAPIRTPFITTESSTTAPCSTRTPGTAPSGVPDHRRSTTPGESSDSSALGRTVGALGELRRGLRAVAGEDRPLASCRG